MSSSAWAGPANTSTLLMSWITYMASISILSLVNSLRLSSPKKLPHPLLIVAILNPRPNLSLCSNSLLNSLHNWLA